MINNGRVVYQYTFTDRSVKVVVYLKVNALLAAFLRWCRSRFCVPHLFYEQKTKRVLSHDFSCIHKRFRFDFSRNDGSSRRPQYAPCHASRNDHHDGPQSCSWGRRRRWRQQPRRPQHGFWTHDEHGGNFFCLNVLSI